MAQFTKGQSGNRRGRPPGAKNKIPGALKEKVMFIVGELECQGRGLLECAQEDPRWFYEHFVKVLLPKKQEQEHCIGTSILDIVREINDRKANRQLT